MTGTPKNFISRIASAVALAIAVFVPVALLAAAVTLIAFLLNGCAGIQVGPPPEVGTCEWAKLRDTQDALSCRAGGTCIPGSWQPLMCPDYDWTQPRFGAEETSKTDRK